MPAVALEENRPCRSTIKVSLYASLLAVASIVGLIFVFAAPYVEAAVTCTWSGGNNNWTAPGIWNCSPAQAFPGAVAGQTDTATFLSSPIVTIGATDLIPGQVALNVTGGAPTINVNGNTLPLASLSMTSGGTIAANSLGTVNVGGSATIGILSKLWLNGGTINNAGTINIANGGAFQASGGTLMGSGATAIASGGTMTFDGLQGPVTIQDAQISSVGAINVSSAANPITMQFLASLTNNGTITLSNDAPINFGGGSASITNNPAATIQKTGGTTSNISVPVNNNGAVNVNVANATIGLLGHGDHTGNFAMNANGSGLTFDGVHNFNAGATFSGAGATTVTVNNANGGTFNVNTGTGLTTSNMINNGTLTFGGPQTLTLSGNYTQGGTGKLNIGNIVGPAAGSNYPLVSASGNYSLSGAVNATLAYAAASGQTFTIIQSAGGNGDFTTQNLVSCCGDSLTEIPPANGPQVQLLATALPADVAVGSISGSPNPVAAVQPVTWSVPISNIASGAASNVALTLTLSSGTMASVTSIAGFTCTLTTTTTARCINPSWAANASGTISVATTSPAQAGTMTLNAAISTTSTETSTTNNSGSGSVAVTGLADLGVVKTLSGPLTAGQNATYNILVSNAGPSDAANVVINDTPGSSLTLVSVSGGGCTTFPCSLATVTAGSSVSLTATFAVAPSATGNVTNTANVTSTTADNNAANNSSPATNAVTTSSDLSVVKTLVGSAIAGQNAAYQIVVKNLGPSDAAAVVVDDAPGPALTFVSATGSGCTAFPCNVGTVAAGSSITVNALYAIPPSATGTITNTGKVNSSTTDSNLSNNTSPVSSAVVEKADVAVTKSGPTSANPGSLVTFTITVANNGPSDAQSVQLNDPTPSRFSLVSVSGACTAFPCALGTMTAGSTKSVTARYTVLSGGSTIVNNTATVTSSTPDPNSANNSATATLSTGCPQTAPSGMSPASGTTNVALAGMLSWSDVGAPSYTVYLDVQGPNACSKFFGTTSATSIPYAGLQPGTTYQWRVEATANGCQPKTTACLTFTTASSCPNVPPTLIAPINTTAITNATFSWTAVTGAKDYLLFVNGTQIAKVNATTFGPTSVPNGQASWYVVAEFDPPCSSLQSQTASFNGCNLAATTIPSIVGQADSNQGYDLSWDPVIGASKYEVDEADNLNFANLKTQSTTKTTLHFQHPVTTPTAFYYRVRPFFDCANGFGANSVVVRIVLSPVTSPTNPNHSVPAGNSTLVSVIVHVPGFPDGTFPFTASLDPKNPFLKSVTPASGSLPPEGIDLTVIADPTGLKAGTHTGTVLLSVITSSSVGNRAPNGVTPVGAPVSISLVTAVTPKPAGIPPANALIIPSTGHLDGVNSRWASDVRILNTSSQSLRYQLTFTPDDTTQSVKQTVITIDANDTTALDDVIKTWYGVGSLGESSNGSLEIRPLDNPSKVGADDVSVSFVTVASSRTYNTASNASNATFGEFIPAIPFSNFVGKGSAILGMQQIAQSDTMRTNLGVMEASGQPASILISVFDNAGKKLLDVPMTLNGGQHAQLNGFLTQNKISLPDGRIEVQVTSGDGKITAYASVIDNKSGDPILISGAPLRQSSFDTFVLPGVADLNTPNAAWRTDMRIFNPTTTAQAATLTFFPQSGTPQSTTMTINGGEVKRLDNTLSSTFGVTNAGGTIHVTTAAPAPLVVTGRTYDVTSNGTYGQLANAITPADAIGAGDRPLQILQAEDSVRQRTNLGVFEVTGKPATVEVTLFVPDSKIAPSTQIPLPANGFIQIPVIQSFGLSNVYNARISLRVVGGDGRISAYGSVIDQLTQDPTYIPAQR